MKAIHIFQVFTNFKISMSFLKKSCYIGNINYKGKSKIYKEKKDEKPQQNKKPHQRAMGTRASEKHWELKQHKGSSFDFFEAPICVIYYNTKDEGWRKEGCVMVVSQGHTTSERGKRKREGKKGGAVVENASEGVDDRVGWWRGVTVWAMVRLVGWSVRKCKGFGNVELLCGLWWGWLVG